MSTDQSRLGTENRPDTEHLDVLVIGAGLSGIAAGYYLQTYSPARAYTILESRQTMGGTWDLFRFPGIRSDSDMFTLGYSFRPWQGDRALVDGETIRQYLEDTALEYGIDRKIRYGHRVKSAAWSSADARWTLQVEQTETGETVEFTASFVLACAGYYDYDEAYTPDFAGRDEFQGQVIHPQFWTDEVDYEGKEIVVIGSGATAVTMVPALAERAEKVTMLQRSPSYVLSLPIKEERTRWLRDKLPMGTGPAFLRWLGVLATIAVYSFCQRFPGRARKILMDGARRQLPDDFDVGVHFNPRYDPWDERLCVAPHGDFFKAIRSGKADVVTDHIERFTRNGILLRSGKELAADMIVTATGLKVRMVGGIEVSVDGRVMRPTDTMCYLGTMFSEVPNFAMVLGYTNASWTLKCELVLDYIMRLFKHMDERGYRSVMPEMSRRRVVEEPFIDMQSGYLQRGRDEMPRSGSRLPWKLFQNYVLDRLLLGRIPLEYSELKFRRTPGPQTTSLSQGAARARWHSRSG